MHGVTKGDKARDVGKGFGEHHPTSSQRRINVAANFKDCEIRSRALVNSAKAICIVVPIKGIQRIKTKHLNPHSFYVNILIISMKTGSAVASGI